MRDRLKRPPGLNREHKLLASPTPFFDESPTSWVQRICAAHQYSMTRLLSVLKMPSRFRDFDLKMSINDWEELLLLTETGTRSCWRAIEVYVATHVLAGGPWLCDPGGLPGYRWCPQCFASDHEPYLRWWWRFAKASHCPYHGCVLLEGCMWCGEPLVLGRAMLTRAGSKMAVDTLAHCQDCGMLRYGPLVLPSGHVSNSDSARQSPSEPVKLLLDQNGDVQLSFYVDDGVTRETPIDRSRTLTSLNFKDVWFLRDPSVATATSFPSDKSGSVPLLRGKSFEATAASPYISVSRGRFVYITRPRSQLANALRVFREEKRALAILPAGHYMRKIHEEMNREAGSGD